MRHFDITEWTDYARELVDETRRRQMSEHLEACSTCHDTLGSLRLVADTAAEESKCSPPDWAVRSVHAFFSAQLPQTAREPKKLATRLAFDSALAPAPAGVRSLESGSRHVVYYAQEFAISLQMDFTERKREIELGGEILHRQSGAVNSVPALLLSGDKVVARSVTGELGEFFMRSSADTSLRLCLMVGSDDLIEVELDRRDPARGNVVAPPRSELEN